ncbi:MAG: hypothetical protein FD131_1858 [Rhodocyclaceae bacterium]|nr:MAG: hypothetical protein FD131_1858 [Rhodocyclaceae bacterium]
MGNQTWLSKWLDVPTHFLSPVGFYTNFHLPCISMILVTKSVFIFLAALLLTACSRTDSVSTIVALEPKDAIPLAWRNSNTLIVDYHGSIYAYDISARKLNQRLVDNYDTTSPHWNCFSPNGGRFAIALPVRSTNTANSARPMATEHKTRYIPDWTRSESYVEDTNSIQWWNTNPFDCSPIDHEERKRKIASLEGEGRFVRSPSPLLLAREGDAFVTLNRSESGTTGRILHLFSYGAKVTSREISLSSATNSPPSDGSDILSFRDSDGSYVIFESNSDFDANRGIWPLTAWRLFPGLTTVSAFVLPSGPWIQPHGFFKSLSCFSCGCMCYAHFELTGAYGHIYAHVHGQSVEDAAAGIYKLIRDKDGANWVLVVAANFSGKALASPEGCRVAYSDADRRLQLVEIKNCK